MIEHCISVLKREARQRTQTLYIADALKNINEILANHYGGGYMMERLEDLITEKKPEKERTGDEIAEDIINRAGLTLKGGG